jgi:hypothetical protein
MKDRSRRLAIDVENFFGVACGLSDRRWKANAKRFHSIENNFSLSWLSERCDGEGSAAMLDAPGLLVSEKA